jgi:hypothetical protein
MDAEKKQFIYDALTEWAPWIHGRLLSEFSKMDIGVTEELLHSLGYKVFTQSGLDGGKYELSFLEYGRMLDMGVGRGVSSSIAANARAYRKASDHKIRQAKKWYSKTTYGGLNRLIRMVIDGYQPAIINTIKTPMEGK